MQVYTTFNKCNITWEFWKFCNMTVPRRFTSTHSEQKVFLHSCNMPVRYHTYTLHSITWQSWCSIYVVNVSEFKLANHAIDVHSFFSVMTTCAMISAGILSLVMLLLQHRCCHSVENWRHTYFGSHILTLLCDLRHSGPCSFLLWPL